MFFIIGSRSISNRRLTGSCVCPFVTKWVVVVDRQVNMLNDGTHIRFRD